MSEEQKFLVCCWAIVASVLISITISITYFNARKMALTELALQKGADPMSATCAHESYESTPCIIWISKH